LEVFIGSGASSDYSGGNVTVAHNQDICFYHFSDAITTVSGRYSTEAVYDILYVASPDWLYPTPYSDTGNFSQTRSAFAGVRWHSDESRLSGGFAVTFKSALSALPSRRAGVAGSAGLPQLLVNGAAAPDDPTGDGPPYTGWRDHYNSSTSIVVGLSVGVPVAVLALVLCIFIIIARRRARRRRRQRETVAPLEGVPAPEPYGAAKVVWGNGNQQDAQDGPPQIAMRGAWPVGAAYGVPMYPTLATYLASPLVADDVDGNMQTPDAL
jgi:hypothetical protein